MRVLFIDDHTLFREAFSNVLRQFDNQMVIVNAANATDALSSVRHYRDLDLIILDLGLPDADGVSIIVELQQLAPTVPIIVLSGNEDPAIVRQALNAGVMGYITKASSSHEVISALQVVMVGDIYVPPQLLAHLSMDSPGLTESAEIDEIDEADETETLPPGTDKNVGLTPRECEVALLIAQRGLPNKLIARELNKEVGTVKIWVSSILNKWQLSNRTQIGPEAQRRGLI